MRTLGIDYGTRRIGLAISDELGMIAMARETLHIQSVKEAVQRVSEAVVESEASCVVVGLPLNMDGSRGRMVEEVEAFVSKLKELVPIPVETWDERLSSQMAERTLLEADMSREKRKRVLDKMAAQAILQGWLDAHSDPMDFPEP
ncbi:MAG: Holliday junction resolvase RuvX [Lentisphaerae bacterium]|nr:Holliday junction resolvase RuvX [Lentisphaerota bacterium]